MNKMNNFSQICYSNLKIFINKVLRIFCFELFFLKKLSSTEFNLGCCSDPSNLGFKENEGGYVGT